MLPSASGAVGVQFPRRGATGRLRGLQRGGRQQSPRPSINVSDAHVDLVLPPQGITTLCDVTPLDEEFVTPVPPG